MKTTAFHTGLTRKFRAALSAARATRAGEHIKPCPKPSRLSTWVAKRAECARVQPVLRTWNARKIEVQDSSYSPTQVYLSGEHALTGLLETLVYLTFLGCFVAIGARALATALYG